MSLRWAFHYSQWHPTKEDWMLAASCLQKEEAERISKFMFKRDAKASLCGRLLLRKAVHDLLQLPYESIQFGRTDKGKPYLIGSDSKLSLNVSHQGDFTVLSASFNYTTGIDVMKVEWIGKEDLDSFFHTMRKQFTDYEWRNIRKYFTEDEQLESFYRHWCLKESYVKALGIGIANDLRAFEFHPKEDEIPNTGVLTNTLLHVNGVLQKNWIFEESRLGEEHLVAVALYPHDNTDDKPSDTKKIVAAPVVTLSFQDLVSSAVSFNKVDDDYWIKFSVKSEKPNLA